MTYYFLCDYLNIPGNDAVNKGCTGDLMSLLSRLIDVGTRKPDVRDKHV